MGVLLFVCCYGQPLLAQIGEHRDDFSIGFNGGYVLSNVGFVPKVNQKQHGGITGGLALRYKSEKYFSTFCSIMAEINYAQLGWKEDILDAKDHLSSMQRQELQKNINAQSTIFKHLSLPTLHGGKKTRGPISFSIWGHSLAICSVKVPT